MQINFSDSKSVVDGSFQISVQCLGTPEECHIIDKCNSIIISLRDKLEHEYNAQNQTKT